jgi:hypothetical protein
LSLVGVGAIEEAVEVINEAEVLLEMELAVAVAVLRQEQPLEILDGIPRQAVAQAGRVADVVAVV